MTGTSWRRAVVVGAAFHLLLALGDVAAFGGFVARVGEETFLEAGASQPESWLEHWLASLEFNLPDTKTKLMGVNAELRGGLCKGLSLDGIRTRKIGKKAMVDAHGLAISCHLDWSFGILSGGVVAKIGNSSMRGSLRLVPDSNSPPMPSAILAERDDCGGEIKVSDLDFSGGVLSDMLEFFHNFIESKLTQDLASIICTQVDKAISTDASAVLRTQVQIARAYLSENSTSQPAPISLSDPKGDLVDLTRNSGLNLLARLTSEVLGNTSSPHSLDAIVSQYLGPGGNLSLDSTGLFPFSQVVQVPQVGLLNITVSSMRFSDLNTWSGLEVKAVDAHRLSMAFNIGEIIADASISLVVAPDDVDAGLIHGSTLRESFDVRVKLHGLGANAGLFVGVNSTYLNTLSVDQLANLGCLIPGLVLPQESSAGFKLTLAETRITPKFGTLEKDLDNMLNTMIGDVLRDYAQALDAAGNQLLSVTVRQAVNKKLQELWALPPVCPDPAPTYASPAVSDGALVTALALGAWALLVLMLSICFVASRRKVSASECQNPRAAPLTLESAVSVVEEARVGATVEARMVTAVPMDDFSLLRHPRLPCSVRLCLPSLVIATMMLFVSSNSSAGAVVKMAITADRESVVDLPPLFSFSLVSSVRDMWTGGAYPLAILIGVFSGVWPYAKLMLMLVCWFVPPQRLSVKCRQGLLDFLDAYGKWSLVDTFVMVLFMVAFHLELSGMGATSPVVAGMFNELGTDAKLAVFIEPTEGFYLFLVATVLSLTLGHAMTACHRRALQIGEYSIPDECLGEGPAGGSMRHRLCQRFSQNRFDRYGPVAAVAVSLALVVAGLCIDTMEFRFLGLTNFALGPEASVRPYSIMSLDLGLPWSSDAPNSFGIRSIQVAFLFFAAVFTPVYLSILLVLWTAPLSTSKHRHFLVAAQVLNAWSGLEVFCVSIAASVLEIRQFAAFMVGHRCDLLNDLVARSPIAKQIQGAPTCFDVESDLKPGLYILSVAAIIAVVTGQVLLSRCSKALFEPHGASQRADSSGHSSVMTALSQPSASAVPQPSTLMRAEP